MLICRGEHRNTRKPTVLQIGEVARLAEALAGVRRTTADGLAQWRYHGRLVARQLDDIYVAIRADSTTAARCCASSRHLPCSRPV